MQKEIFKKGCRRRFWAKPQRIKCCASPITRFNTDWQVYGYCYDKQCPLKLSEKAGIDRLPTQFITNLIIELNMLKKHLSLAWVKEGDICETTQTYSRHLSTFRRARTLTPPLRTSGRLLEIRYLFSVHTFHRHSTPRSLSAKTSFHHFNIVLVL